MSQRPTHVSHEKWSGVVGYISVPAAIADKVLGDGYRCGPHREHVPLSFDPLFGDRMRRQNQSGETESVCLEVYNLSDELKAKLDRERGWLVGVTHLPAQHLRDGSFTMRAKSEYEGVPCPLCGKDLDDNVDARLKVGRMCMTGGAFRCVPCDNEECIAKMVESNSALTREAR
jgi:hypothetical protein